jgi:hypothetical protein
VSETGLWDEALLHAPESSALRVGEEMKGAERTFTWIGRRNELLSLWDDETPALPLTDSMIEAVMKRYARPLAALGALSGVLRLDSGSVLAHMLYLPRFEVVPKDYLVWAEKGQEPRGELCAHLLPPLLHLARRLKAQSPP